MDVYKLVYGELAVFTLICLRVKSERIKKVLYFMACVTLILVSALRDLSVGADTMGYCRRFALIRKYVTWEALSYGNWEKGYVFLNKIIGVFFSDERALIVILSFVILVPFFKWLYEESSFPMMALLIFVSMGFWYSSMYIYRQYCAMAILTFAYKYVKEKKLLPTVLLVLLAMLFHRTAVAFLFIYIMYIVKIQVNALFLITMAGSVLIYALRYNIYTFLNQFARIPAPAVTRGGITLLITLWIVFLAAFFLAKSLMTGPKMKLYVRVLAIAVFTQPLVFAFSQWARMEIYFTPAIAIVIPEVFEHVINSKGNRRFAIPICMLLCAFLYVWYAETLPSTPYTFMQITKR